MSARTGGDRAEEYLGELLRWYESRKEHWTRLGQVADNIAGDFEVVLREGIHQNLDFVATLRSDAEDFGAMRIVLWTTEVLSSLTDCIVFAESIRSVRSRKAHTLPSDPDKVQARLDEVVAKIERTGFAFAPLLNRLQDAVEDDVIRPSHREGLFRAAAVRHVLIHTAGRINSRNARHLPGYSVGEYVRPADEWLQFEPVCTEIIHGFKNAVQAYWAGGSSGGRTIGTRASD